MSTTLPLVLRAFAKAFAGLCPTALVAGDMYCEQVDALADLLRALDEPGAAGDWIYMHTSVQRCTGSHHRLSDHITQKNVTELVDLNDIDNALRPNQVQTSSPIAHAFASVGETADYVVLQCARCQYRTSDIEFENAGLLGRTVPDCLPPAPGPDRVWSRR